jgi:Ca2+-transporting ATPase
VVYFVALRFDQSEREVRALTFAAFLLSNLALIFTNRSWSRVILSSSLRDATLWTVTGGAIAFLGLVLYVPALARLFQFAALGAWDLVICFAAGALSITWFEIVKWLGLGRGHEAPAGQRPAAETH